MFVAGKSSIEIRNGDLNDRYQTQHYSHLEEKTNIVSHAIGLVLSVAALLLMLLLASKSGDALHVVSAGIFGFSLIALYAASTLYHSAKDLKVRSRLRMQKSFSWLREIFIESVFIRLES